MEYFNLMFFAFIVAGLFEGLGDGYFQRKLQTYTTGLLYHIFWALAILFIGLGFYYAPRIDYGFIIALTIFSFTRFGVFSPSRNIAYGEHILYIGDTAGSDKILNRLFGWNRFMKGVLMAIRWALLWFAHYAGSHWIYI